MATQCQPIFPPAPKVHAKDLPIWRFVLAFSRNTLSTLSDSAFDTLISRRRVLGLDSILVSDPEGIRHVLATEIGKYRRPMSSYRVFRPFAGNGVLLADGSEWRRQRRMLAPIFTPANVGLLLPHFAMAAAVLVKRIEKERHGANLSAAFQEATLDAVLRALFSLPDTELNERVARLVRDYLRGPGRPNILDGFARTESAFAFATRKRRRFQNSWVTSVDDVVARRRNAGTSGNHGDLLDLLLRAHDPVSGSALSDAEVRDQCGTMLAAGYETTARLLFWATYLLTLDLDRQRRVRAEVAAFPPDLVTRLDDLLNWPLVRQTLLEALRLYPPVAYITREAIANDTVAGEPVRPGTLIWISPWVLHRHRKFWRQPTAFMPERFANMPASWNNDGAFTPFGAGPRICIGATFAMAEAQIMLATILSRFRIKLDNIPPVLPVANVTTAPSYEPQFQLERL
jgi:cytochrome P450